MKQGLNAVLISLIGLVGCSDEKKQIQPQETQNTVIKVERKLVNIALMQASSIQNRMLDPHFTSKTGAGRWYFEMPRFEPGKKAIAYHHAIANAPSAQHTLLMPGHNANPSGINAWGTFKLSSNSHQISAWLGVDANNEFTDKSIAAHFFNPTLHPHDDLEQSLEANIETEQLIGNIRWIKYTTTIAAGATGWGYLAISNHSNESLYVNGPEVLKTDNNVVSNTYKRASVGVRQITQQIRHQQESQLQ